MKKILLNFCLFFAVIIFAFAFRQLKHHSNSTEVSSSQDGGEDIDGYLKWEQQRLADPATGRIPDNIRNLELGFAAGLPNDLQNNNKSFCCRCKKRGYPACRYSSRRNVEKYRQRQDLGAYNTACTGAKCFLPCAGYP